MQTHLHDLACSSTTSRSPNCIWSRSWYNQAGPFFFWHKVYMYTEIFPNLVIFWYFSHWFNMLNLTNICSDPQIFVDVTAWSTENHIIICLPDQQWVLIHATFRLSCSPKIFISTILDCLGATEPARTWDTPLEGDSVTLVQSISCRCHYAGICNLTIALVPRTTVQSHNVPYQVGLLDVSTKHGVIIYLVCAVKCCMKCKNWCSPQLLPNWLGILCLPIVCQPSGSLYLLSSVGHHLLCTEIFLEWSQPDFSSHLSISCKDQSLICHHL